VQRIYLLVVAKGLQSREDCARAQGPDYPDGRVKPTERHPEWEDVRTEEQTNAAGSIARLREEST
jgi:hypothetical protein